MGAFSALKEAGETGKGGCQGGSYGGRRLSLGLHLLLAPYLLLHQLL